MPQFTRNDLFSTEMLALNAEIDAINTALDSWERKNDLINIELRNILRENAEAKKEIQEVMMSEGEK